MIKKLVDNTQSIGRAEKELLFSPRFLRFIRGKYNLNDITKIDGDLIKKKFNLKGIVYGNYTTQEKRHFYLYKTSKQMELLAKLKGSNNLGKGILTISIGGHGIGGNINAHYSPSEDLINLARGRKGDYSLFMKGENSFVHEYGHFIDFEQGRRNDKKLSHNFASENLNPNWSNKTTLLYSDPVSKVIEDKAYFDELPTPYYRKRIEVFARLFEAAITHHVHAKEKSFNAFFNRSYSEKVYYPKSKILSLGLDKAMIKCLRSS